MRKQITQHGGRGDGKDRPAVFLVSLASGGRKVETQPFQASWAPPARLGSLPSVGPSSLPRTICYPWPTTPRALRAKLVHAFSCQPSSKAPDLVQAHSSVGALESREGKSCQLFLKGGGGHLHTELRRAGKWPKRLGLWHGSSWILGISA